MEKKWKIGQILASVILAVVIVFCIVTIAQVMSRGYVTICGRSLFRVVTGSMEPTIPTGSLLIANKIEIEEIQAGDIICFRSKDANMLGQVITHRVVDITFSRDGQLLLETRGDANPAADGYYVTESNLIGIVTKYTENGNPISRIFSLITSKTGFMSCVAIPVLAIAGWILKDSLKSMRREIRQINRCLDAQERSQQKQEMTLQDLMSEEEYQELVAQMKMELLEEVKHSAKETSN